MNCIIVYNDTKVRKDIEKEIKYIMENNSEYFENRPVTMNEHNNLLQIEEHMYQLQDVEKPNAPIKLPRSRMGRE